MQQNRYRFYPYDILIDLEARAPSITIRRNRAILHTIYAVPKPLQFLSSPYRSIYFEENFLNYLLKWGNTTPILLKTKAGETLLSWDASRVYKSQTEVNVMGGTVVITALGLLNKIVREPIYLMGNLVADLTDDTLGIVEKADGWRFYDRLAQLFLSDPLSPNRGFEPISIKGKGTDFNLYRKEEHRFLHRSFTIPLKAFQSVQINIATNFLSVQSPQQGKSFHPCVVRDLSLKVLGQTRPIQTSQHAYRLNINLKTATHFKITVECRLGDNIGMPHAPTFCFFTYLEQSRSLPVALRAKKRKGYLIDLFLSLALSAKTRSDAHALISDAFPSEGLSWRDKDATIVAQDILKHFFSVFISPDWRLHFHENQWQLVSNNKLKEAVLYQTLLKHLGPQIFYGIENYNEMLVPCELLHEKLAFVHSAFKDSGIELFYKGSRIIPSKWDFSFDARRHPGIDWFEMKPEIKCDGVAVRESSWRNMLTGGGVIEKDGVVHILDDDARKILKSLGAIYKMARKTNAGKKEVVHVPRLQILDWVTLRHQGVKVLLSDEDEALLMRLTEFTKIEPTDLPQKLNAVLRPYQKDGYHWLSFLYRHRFGAALADDMGLGKTLQAINFLGGIKEGIIAPAVAVTGPHLIVLPPSLLFNWESEIARFYPSLKIHFYIGPERNTSSFDDCDVVMTTYGLIRRDIENLKDIPFHVIIFDEAQAIKNIYANTTCAVRQLTGYFKMVMTGTPLENHLGEYYSLIDLCLPGLLGEYDPFKSQLTLDASKTTELLIRRTRPFVMRRTKESVLKDLPPKTETDVYLELTNRQKALYQQTVAEIRSTIDAAYQKKNNAQARIIALTAILKLRQLCISPRLLTHNATEPSPKIDFLIGKLHELMEENHSALVFSQFTSFLDIVEESLQSENIPFSRLDGKTATGKRKALVESFQAGESPSVFLLSLKAGGQGLNLTKASYVFHLDPWWNPAVENQATDRAHRIGQTQKVAIIRILMRHTIEEKMMTLKQKKLSLYEAVMGDPAKRGRGFSISKSDFDFLLDG